MNSINYRWRKIFGFCCTIGAKLGWNAPVVGLEEELGYNDEPSDERLFVDVEPVTKNPHSSFDLSSMYCAFSVSERAGMEYLPNDDLDLLSRGMSIDDLLRVPN